MEEVIKSYKGFNKDMTCTPPGTDIKFQYEEGESYEMPDSDACRNGSHACEYPLDCFRYYSPAQSLYHEVEQSGKISRSDDGYKVASTKIKIGASINIAGMVKAVIEYTTKRIKAEDISSNTGDYGASSNTGYKGTTYAGEKESVAVAWGYKSRAKGVLGAYLVFADWEGDESEYWKPDSWTLKGAKMVQVDGENIKEETWYIIENGEIKEYKEGE